MPARLCIARTLHLLTTAWLYFMLVSCSGSSHSYLASYSVGGSVTGLVGTLQIRNNNTDTLVLTSSGAFIFAAKISDGTAYNVTVSSQPAGLLCSISNGNGVIRGNDIDNIIISCVDNSHTLIGTISVADNTAVDSDVNDPLADYADNDDALHAQALGNPVILGGFISATTSGISSGRFAFTPDLFDYYAITMAAGQTITLSISDYDANNPASVDIDLLLYDAGNTLVQSSEGTNVTESITVASSGSYFLAVSAHSGFSNYTLNIGAQPLAASPLDLNLSSEFVPGEIIVHFKDTALSQALTRQPLQTMPLHLKSKSASTRRPVLYGLGSNTQRLKALADLGVQPRILQQLSHSTQIDTQTKRETFHAIKALRKRDDVLSADLNYIRHPAIAPNDSLYNFQWHYPIINLPQAWDVTTGSSAVIVAVIDTGIFMSHPDLAANLTTTGYDFISSTSISNDGNGIDNNPDDPGDSSILGQSSWHGTHVAGTIAASSNNTTGVAGVSWSSRIMPLRALGVGGGTSYDILQAVRYAAQLSNDSNTVPAEKADIINLSLGGSGNSQAEQNTFTEARNAGVIIIAAAGNSNTSELFYPASYAGVVSVSAVDANKNKAPYSNYGTAVDIAGPGGDASVDTNNDGYGDGVLSTLVNDASGTRQPIYAFYQGTSMAAPHIAGVAALMSAVRKNDGASFTPDEFDAFITTGSITTDLGAAGRDDIYGYGLIDAFMAVQAASSTTPTTIVVNPASLNFGQVTSSADLVLTATKLGTGNLIITGTTSSDSWLTITPTTVDASGLGTYTVTVSRDVLADGIYSGTISFQTASTSFTVNVTTQFGSPATQAPDAGELYVFLVDSSSLNATDMQIINSVNGIYTYSFNNVANGDYVLIAGSDMDNDFIVCDAGEACGAYPILGPDLGVISVDNDINGIDFSVSFSSDIRANNFTITNSNMSLRSLMNISTHALP